MVIAPIYLFSAAATFDQAFRAGLVALQGGDLAGARTSLEEAVKLAPANGRGWVALAQAYRKLGELPKATAAVGKAEALGGRDAIVQSGLAFYYAESSEPLKAAEAQFRYAELAPQDKEAKDRAEAMFFQGAEPLLQRGDFAGAVTILEAGTKRLTDSAQLQMALGVACYGLRRFNEAAAAFVKTIELAPEVPQPYTFLGRFLDQIPARMPELTKMFIAYEKANPESFTGYFLHAKALNVQSLDPETAKALLEKALSINDQDAPAHFELGSVLDRLRRFPEALKEFERAAQLAPNDPAVHYRLSRVYDRLGRTEEAQAERDRHLTLERSARGVK